MPAFLWNWYTQPWRKYAQFTGRACRFECWTFFLTNFVIAMALIVIPHTIFIRDIFSLAILIPGIALSVRRLHDRGLGGWYMLILLIPVLGGLVLAIIMLFGSRPGKNKWGPDPTEAHNPPQAAPEIGSAPVS
jgi:uncharacterized membrane protein YhaH (DUF805 family)